MCVFLYSPSQLGSHFRLSMVAPPEMLGCSEGINVLAPSI